LNGWRVVEGGNRAFYRNGVRVGRGQAGANGQYLARNLVTPYGTFDFMFNNQGHLLVGLRSHQNAWHYFCSISGVRQRSNITGWWTLPTGHLRFLILNGTYISNGLRRVSWHDGTRLIYADYLFDVNGFLITNFDFNIEGGLSVHSFFGNWWVMSTSGFNVIGGFHAANGGGWFSPRPGALRYLTIMGDYRRGVATVVGGRVTIPNNTFNTAWATIGGNQFLFCTRGYLQFGGVYMNGVRVAFINANGVRT